MTTAILVPTYNIIQATLDPVPAHECKSLFYVDQFGNYFKNPFERLFQVFKFVQNAGGKSPMQKTAPIQSECSARKLKNLASTNGDRC